MIKNTSELQFQQEFGCEFLGSSNTLISGSVLARLPFFDPKQKINDVRIYEDPKPGNSYALIADVSRGVGLDYSAFVVVDITKVPYEVVAAFHDNLISPLLFPTLIHNVGMHYNEAMVAVEINDNGQSIIDALWEEYEYTNIVSSSVSVGRGGVRMGIDETKQMRRGIRTTSPLS